MRKKVNVFWCMLIALSIAFVLSMIFTNNEKTEAFSEDTANNTAELTVYNPIAGQVIALADVNDAAFSSGVLGAGYAVVPSEGKVYAPFDGKVETLMDTHHALGIVPDSGIEMLIHVGLNTVTLGGKYFTPKAAEGDTFKKGDLLLEFDTESIKKEGFDITTPIIVSNVDDYTPFTVYSADNASVGTKILELAKA